MIGRKTQWILKTCVIAIAVAAAFAALFVLQIQMGIGPAGAMTQPAAGSPEWFAAAGRWVAIEKYFVWPLLILLGVTVHRRWCRDSPSWMAALIAAPAVSAQFSTTLSDLLVCVAYLALALVMSLNVARIRVA